MFKRIKSIIQKIKFRKISLIQGLIFGLFINLFIIFKTHAFSLFSIGDFTSTAIYSIFSWVAHLIALIASQIIILEAKILALVVNASAFTTLPVVQTGWRIARDFANILFIVILIYIAFSYILRVQSRQTKGLLVKMIIMAILINFSLMIGGAIIDFSNMFFRYFIFGSLGADPTGLGGVRFTNALADALTLQTFMQSQVVATPTASSTEAEWTSWIQAQMVGAEEKTALMGIAKLAFTIVFSFLVIIIFGALVGILFVRLFWLWILLIFAPLAWVISLISIPGTPAGISKQWWSKFLQWCFVAPVMGFFVYLALETASHVKQLHIPGTLTAGGLSSVMYNLQSVMQMFLVAGFIVAGLIAGEKMGATIAGKALGLAKQTGNKVSGAVKGKASLWALRAANVPATGLEKAASKNKLARAAISLTGLGIASRYVSRKSEEAKSKEWSNRVKKYENVSVGQLKQMANSALIPEERAAMFAVLAKKGGIDDSNKDKALPLLSKYSKEDYKKIIKDHPEWHPDVQSAVKTGKSEEVIKAIRKADIEVESIKLDKIKDPIVLSGVVQLKLETNPEQAASELRNLDLPKLDQLTSEIKRAYETMDEETKKEFRKKIKSGFNGRMWFKKNLEGPTLVSSSGKPIT